jgi:Uma2 family endonuclease
MPISEETYERVALEDPEGFWELHCGKLRQKPDMAADHNEIMSDLHGWLFQQLDREQFRVRSNAGRVRRSAQNYYIPDVSVIPADRMRAQLGTRRLEFCNEPLPLPLVVEIWSPSTGDYDVDEKLPEYKRRGDLEIWRIHPFERTLISWVRQPDGSYAERTLTGGVIHPAALPGVSIDLDRLFALG